MAQTDEKRPLLPNIHNVQARHPTIIFDWFKFIKIFLLFILSLITIAYVFLAIFVTAQYNTSKDIQEPSDESKYGQTMLAVVMATLYVKILLCIFEFYAI